ncbi:MAG TPA: heparinase II/III-family protein [Chthoniobacteraceae bacterium]|nr:heparinase II/III-family protein [Chthoniobacteraceae bacterium]
MKPVSKIGWTRGLLLALLFGVTACLLLSRNQPADLPPGKPPAPISREYRLPVAPRVFLPAPLRAPFRQFCREGEGREAFRAMKAEFDERDLTGALPEEPQDDGSRLPLTPESIRISRDGQIACNRISGIAEAATLLWLVTGEEPYKARAREALLQASGWDPPVLYYNDEAVFRLWRRLPFVYDQLRGELSPAERESILAGLKRIGEKTALYVISMTGETRRNSAEGKAPSHAVRFVPMIGLAGLALYDDLDAAPGWLRFALHFYREQYPPYGGDDGGYAEGCAYWRGTVEHGRFQDALLSIGHPDAWKDPFWRQTGYFPLYFVGPQPTYTFGDTPRPAGKMTLEPAVTTFMNRLGRRFRDPYLIAGARQPGVRQVNRRLLNISSQDYPGGMEYLLQDFFVSLEPPVPPGDLTELPPTRSFNDVGWVSLHSAPGRPEEDIALAFKSSPHGAVSHAFADQNAFLFSAYGKPLAIRAGHRDFYSSDHYVRYTRTTAAQNALLIGGRGQAHSPEASGRIVRCVELPRAVWLTGDATQAYASGAQTPPARVRRDLLFIDRRYLVVADEVELSAPDTVQWLLHSEGPMKWNPARSELSIENGGVHLRGVLLAGEGTFRAEVTSTFPVPVHPDYLERRSHTRPDGSVIDLFPDEYHFSASTGERVLHHRIYAVLWPEKGDGPGPRAVWDGEWLSISRPDGKSDRLRLAADRVEIESPGLHQPGAL